MIRKLIASTVLAATATLVLAGTANAAVWGQPNTHPVFHLTCTQTQPVGIGSIGFREPLLFGAALDGICR